MGLLYLSLDEAAVLRRIRHRQQSHRRSCLVGHLVRAQATTDGERSQVGSSLPLPAFIHL